MKDNDSLNRESSISDEEDFNITDTRKELNTEGCFYNFSNEIFKISVFSYFFWTGFYYIIGSIIFSGGYTSNAPRIDDQIVCPATSNVYVFSILWFCFGIIFIFTCIGYSIIADRENNKINAKTASLFAHTLGILCKTIPTVVRLLHIFNLFQLYIITIDFLFLPECNFYSLRIILFVIHIFWWFIVFSGIVYRNKVFLPPYLYTPISEETGFLMYLNNLLRSFGL